MIKPKISLFSGDITTLEVDAIVNAVNVWCLGGGGVDAVIHSAAGPELRKACKRLPIVRDSIRCPTGESRITEGYLLPAKYVIYTAGPVYQEDIDEECATLLRSCYLTSLVLARDNNIKTVAFPGISTGVYRYPLAKASEIACNSINTFCDGNPGTFEEIIFVVFNKEAEAIYTELLR